MEFAVRFSPSCERFAKSSTSARVSLIGASSVSNAYEDTTERIYVGAFVDARRIAAGLFGRHVTGRAHDVSRLRDKHVRAQVGIRCGLACLVELDDSSAAAFERMIFAAPQSMNQDLAVVSNHYVFWFEITVNHRFLLAVRKSDRITHLLENRQQRR